MNKRAFLLYFIFILNHICLFGEPIDEIRFNHIGLDKGLSHSTVSSVVEDSLGFLWVGTFDGLNRYDGYNFRTYRNSYTDKNSIANDMIRCVMVDGEDNIWAGTNYGLSVYNRDKDNFTNYRLKINQIQSPVTSLLSLSKDTLLVGTTQGAYYFNKKDKQLTGPICSKYLVSCLYKYRNRVYLASQDTIYSFLTDRMEEISKYPITGCNSINALLQYDKEHLWVGTEGMGILLLSFSSSQEKIDVLKRYGIDNGLKSNFVRSLGLDCDGQLWAGTYNGLYIYRQKTDRFEIVKENVEYEHRLSQNSVRVIFRDHQNTMWLGTYWGGLNYHSRYANQFKHIKHLAFENSISNNLVNCIVEDSLHNVWIGTSDGGLNMFDFSKKQYYKFNLDNNHYDNLSFKDVKSVLADGSKIYVGTHAGGMVTIDTVTGRLNYYNMSNGKLPSNNIYSIIKDSAGILWLASLDGLIKYDMTDESVSLLKMDQEGNSIATNLKQLYIDDMHRFWIGGEGGVVIYKFGSGGIVKDKEVPVPALLKDSPVNYIYKTKESNICIGTRNGLFIYAPKKNSFVQYSMQNGLPSNVIYGIQEDETGAIWVSTNQGLSKLERRNGIIRNYTILDGLQSNQFNSGSCYTTSSGQMLFGGVNGITAFYPMSLVDNPYSPMPILTKLVVSNREVLPGDGTNILESPIYKSHKIELNHRQNSFTLYFVAINYISGGHNTYRYILKGYDEQWTTQDELQPVSYSNLSPGKYTFILESANNDGVWCKKPVELEIRVHSAWYTTWWALALFSIPLLCFLLVIYRFLYLRSKMKREIEREKKDKEAQEEMYQMKIRFYINISHELRTPLTLIVTPLQELLGQVKNQWERIKLNYIYNNAQKLLHLVNQMIDYRRAELGIFELRVSENKDCNLIEDVFLNYEIVAEKKEIEYHFISELKEREYYIFDRNYVELILNNLLSNSFKFSCKGDSITVRLYEEDEFLVLKVIDTGIGIPEDKQAHLFECFYQVNNDGVGSGIGLSLVKRLAELHHGKIVLKSKENIGTEVAVYIPQNKNVYKYEEFVHEELITTQKENSHLSVLLMNDDEQEPDNRMLPAEKSKLLIVEDNDDLRNYMLQELSDSFSVVGVSNGKEALDYIEDHSDVDLIITDIMMPEVDGIQLCKKLKRNLNTCHIPIYILSAKSDIKCQLEGLQVGADDYISKPFTMAILRNKITNHLVTRRMAYEKFSNTRKIEPKNIANNHIDKEFLNQALSVVHRNIDNAEFTTDLFANEMNLSRSTLHNKLKAITGKSAIDFIHKIRFDRACELIEEGHYSVSEICFMVGYNSPSYFTARFKKYVGCLPTEYMKKAK